MEVGGSEKKGTSSLLCGLFWGMIGNGKKIRSEMKRSLREKDGITYGEHKRGEQQRKKKKGAGGGRINWRAYEGSTTKALTDKR